MKRITKAALGGVAGCALILGATQFAAGASDQTTYEFARRLIDVQLNPDAAGPFDSARARLQISETADGSTFTISIEGIDPSASGPFGAHLHTKQCVKGDTGGLLAGPHYKHDIDAPASSTNEVWFNLLPTDGTATSTTSVEFKVLPGDAQSVVIHAAATNESPDQFVPGPIGNAGARWACLPVDYGDLQ